MATTSEIGAGANALKTYLDGVLQDAGEEWEENFISPEAYVTGCLAIINAADRGTQKPASRQANGEAALRAALQTAGFSDRVTDAQVTSAVQVVLAAIGALR